jgi:hypothetical protein
MSGSYRVLLVVGLALVAISVAAKNDDSAVALQWLPDTKSDAAPFEFPVTMRITPARFQMTDVRTVDSPAAIGTREDARGGSRPLLATRDVVPWIADVTRQTLEGWGLRLRDDGGLALDVKLVRFEVVESDRSFGAEYRAGVQLEVELRGSSSRTLWSGNAKGEASRRGRKSADNVNRALSDALFQALHALATGSRFQEAWSGAGKSSAAP